MMKSKRIKADWAKRRAGKKKNGLVHPKIYPFWIDISSGEPVVIEKKAEMVKKIFHLAIHEGLSYGQTCDYLKEHYPDDAISINVLRKLFSKKKVLGIYEPTAVKNDGSGEIESLNEEINAYPAIIDEEAFYRAKAEIIKRKFLRSGRPAKQQFNFFRSILKCGYCGHAISANGTVGRARYYCYQYKFNRVKCGFQTALTVDYLQPVLLQALAVISRDDLLVGASTTKRNKLSKELATIEAEIEDKQKRVVG